MDFIVIQLISGLAIASELFLVASGLSIVFGVTRIVNFAHGSFYMLGGYFAVTLIERLAASGLSYWLCLLLAAAGVAVVGLLMEITILRRIYRAPELFQLLATFGVVLIVQDLVLIIWGPEDILGPRAPGLEGAVEILGHSVPAYELFLTVVGPLVWLGLWLLFRRTTWGVLVRAATEDREMVATLGVRQNRLFTTVFLLGALLAGLGGAIQVPREAIHHTMDLEIIVEAFVVVVIGGLGSVTGAFLASVIIGLFTAFGIVLVPQITLVLVFLVMVVVLVVRPRGLLGKDTAVSHTATGTEPILRPQSFAARNVVFALTLILAALPAVAGPYALAVASEVLIFVLFAASLHLLMGIGGLVSFGHAAYFGLGAYGAALATKYFGLPMELALLAGPLLAGVGGLVYGWFCVRLSGVYLAMLTLAFAQITWSLAFQWYDFTGGDNGLLGIWPSSWASSPPTFYLLTLALTGISLFLIRRIIFSPFGYAFRACRDSGIRAETIGIDRLTCQWLAFAVAGVFAGLAGALYVYLKGSVFPDVLAIPVSVDGLVMVLLGGIQTLTGPIAGAVVYKTLHILLSSYTDYWRLIIGVVILGLVVAFPQGIVGYLKERRTALVDAAAAGTQ